MEEIWKDIEGFEGYYQVSSFGRVKSLQRVVTSVDGVGCPLKERILKNLLNGDGYYVVNLYKNGKGKLSRVHRLMAVAFIPNPENKPQINHKNGVRTDNSLYNLEWVTASENAKHSHDYLSRKKVQGEKCKSAKLTEVEVLAIRNSNLSRVELSKVFKVSYQTISNILKYKKWKHI